MRNFRYVLDDEPSDASLRETAVKIEMEYKSHEFVVLLCQVSTIINGRLFEVLCRESIGLTDGDLQRVVDTPL